MDHAVLVKNTDPAGTAAQLAIEVLEWVVRKLLHASGD